MSVTKQKMTVSDKISNEKITAWNTNNIIVIQAGTGAGKSYFIKNKLYNYAKLRNEKILYLVHRAPLAEQFKMEVRADRKDDIINIKTYQSIEAKITNNKECAETVFGEYRYIVCDEFHYFCGDSSFNSRTDISFKNIFKYDKAIKICMSATPDEMKKVLTEYANHLELKFKSYVMRPDYKAIERLVFYDSPNKPEEILRSLKSDSKAIVFCKEIKEALRLHNIFKNSLFLCSKSAKEYKNVDEEAINKMLKEEKFDAKILFTTTCFDAGANLKDRAIDTIIVDNCDINSLIQCVGRKRIIDDSDWFDLYIKRYTNAEINGWRTKAREKIAIGKCFLENKNEFVRKYGKENSDMIYTELQGDNLISCLNILRYSKAIYQDELFTEIIECGIYGYCQYLAEIFGKCYKDSNGDLHYTYGLDNDRIAQLDEKLLFMSGVDPKRGVEIMYTTEDRNNLIEAINYRINGRLVRNREKLNERLEELGLDYYIEKTTAKDENGKIYRSAWYVEQLISEPEPKPTPIPLTPEEKVFYSKEYRNFLKWAGRG